MKTQEELKKEGDQIVKGVGLLGAGCAMSILRLIGIAIAIGVAIAFGVAAFKACGSFL